jgi:hypothetical protein
MDEELIHEVKMLMGELDLDLEQAIELVRIVNLRYEHLAHLTPNDPGKPTVTE